MIGLHIQYEPPEWPLLLALVQPTCVLYFQPPEHVKLRPLTVGRLYYANQTAMLENPLAAGRMLADDAIAHAHTSGIPIWVGLNEPDVSNGDAIARLLECERERTQRLNAAGLQAAVLSFSVGWPRENMATRKLETEPFDTFMRWLPPQNSVALHEYWGPAGPLAPDSYDPVYPSKIWRFRHWPYDTPIIITECGIDVAGATTDGWQSHVPRGMNLENWAEQYIDQIKTYADLVCADQRVRGMCVYTFGPGYGWGSFDIASHWQQFVRAFQHTPRPAPPVPPVVLPVQPPTIRVIINGDVQTMPVEEYLRGVVPSEMGAEWMRIPNDPADLDGPSLPQLTKMEALRAQAVLARSYALWRIAHPRHDSFDLYATASDQVYNPARIHFRSDTAIRDTTGVYLVDAKGAARKTEFVSACGRADCGWCQGRGGYSGKVWGTRVCQFGAQARALEGCTWKQIIASYYGEVTYGGI